MNYYLDMGVWSGIFAVPNSVVDKNLKLCGENELKVLLCTLRHNGVVMDKNKISDETGVGAAFIDDALDFWVQQGVLSTQKTSPSAPVQEFTPPAAAGTPSGFAERKMLRPDGVYISKRMKECPELEHLMAETETALGKTLSPSLAAVLINAHDDYGLPCEVIMIIISYAVSVGKTTTAYLEALTREWSQSGVFTMADAEKKLNDLSERSIAWKKLSTAIGLPLRSPTKKEDEFTYKWVCTWKLPVELIRESYERCVNNIGKMQMSYMDKILSKWYSLGLLTTDSVTEYESRAKSAKEERTSTYSLDEIEKMDFFTINK